MHVQNACMLATYMFTCTGKLVAWHCDGILALCTLTLGSFLHRDILLGVHRDILLGVRRDILLVYSGTLRLFALCLLTWFSLSGYDAVMRNARWSWIFSRFAPSVTEPVKYYPTFIEAEHFVAGLGVSVCLHPCIHVLLLSFVRCLTSQQHASVSQTQICLDNCTCCHIEIEVAGQTCYLTRSQYTDNRPTSSSADPISSGAWQGSHWNTVFGITRPGKKPSAKAGIEPRSATLKADTLTTWPTRRYMHNYLRVHTKHTHSLSLSLTHTHTHTHPHTTISIYVEDKNQLNLFCQDLYFRMTRDVAPRLGYPKYTQNHFHLEI